MASRSGYVLTNGLYYISYRNKLYTPCTKEELATVWDKKEKAENVALCLPKPLRKQGYLALWIGEEPKATPIAQTQATPFPSPKKQEAVYAKPAFVLGKTGIKPLDDIFSSFCGMADTLADLQNMRAACEAGVRGEDLIQQDLLHKIEFESGAKGNAAHLCTQLKSCRLRRRAYKDMLLLIDGAATDTKPESWTGYVHNKVHELYSRTYAPRTEGVFQS